MCVGGGRREGKHGWMVQGRFGCEDVDEGGLLLVKGNEDDTDDEFLVQIETGICL